jgi:hypothetical protein
MSAPQTNIEKQKKRHKGPLIGMALAVVFGVGLIFFWLMDEAADGQSPLDPEPASEATTAPQAGTAPTGNTP